MLPASPAVGAGPVFEASPEDARHVRTAVIESGAAVSAPQLGDANASAPRSVGADRTSLWLMRVLTSVRKSRVGFKHVVPPKPRPSLLGRGRAAAQPRGARTPATRRFPSGPSDGASTAYGTVAWTRPHAGPATWPALKPTASPVGVSAKWARFSAVGRVPA